MKSIRAVLPLLIGGILVIGLLSFFQPSASQAAPLAQVRTLAQTTITDFNSGSFHRTGMTQVGNGEVTLLRIGIAGQWITTINSTGLVPRDRHASIAYNNRIYVFGGSSFNGTLRSIQSASVNTVTHNLSNWITTTNSLSSNIYTYTLGNSGVTALSAVELNGRVYLMGGEDGLQLFRYSAVSFATIDPVTGEIGPLAATTPLPRPLSEGQAVVLNDRIYFIAGRTGSNNKGTSQIYYASPNPATGVITAWFTATAPLPYPTYGHMAVATVNGNIYAVAGVTQSTLSGIVPYVYYAQPYTSTGDISTWTITTALPLNDFGGAAVSFAGEIYATGGSVNNVTSPIGGVFAALESPNGGVSDAGWINTSGIITRMQHSAVVNSDGWIYVVGGSDGFLPIQQGIVNAGATTGQFGSAYVPDGSFLANPFDLGHPFPIQQLQWVTTLADPSVVSLTLRYRTSLDGGTYSDWSPPYPSNYAAGVSTTTLPISVTARYLQYQAFFSTTDPANTPVFSQISAQFIVPDPPQFIKSAIPANGSNVDAGKLITYTVIYSNVSDSDLTNAIIYDRAPVSTTYVPGSIFATVSGVISSVQSSPALTWTLGTLPKHTGGAVGFTVRVNNNVNDDDVILNSASFNSDVVGAISNQVSHIVGNPPKLLKSYTSNAPAQTFGAVQPGNLIAYTLIYTNPREAVPLTNVIITDQLPVSVTYAGYFGSIAPNLSLLNSQRIIQWSIGTVPALASGAVGYFAQVLPNTAMVPDGGQIVNTARLGSYGHKTVSAASTTPVRYQFDMLLTMDDRTSTASPGSILTYTIRITNSTSMPVTPTRIAIYDYLEPGRPVKTPGVLHCLSPCTGWTFDSISPDGSLVYSRTLPYLGPNQSTVVTMVAQVSPTLWTNSPGVLAVANKSYVIDDGRHGAEINPINQVAEDLDVVNGPDLAATRLSTAGSGLVLPGKTSQFVATLTNNGFAPATAANGFYVDLYVKPAGSLLPASPADLYQGYCLNASNYPCTTQPSQRQVVNIPGGLGVGQTYAVTYTLPITPAGLYWLYVQADTYWGQPPTATNGTAVNGRIVEGNEVNNLFGPLGIKVDYAKIYLPLVLKKVR